MARAFVLALLAALAAATAAPAGEPQDLLPDLVQRAPFRLDVQTGDFGARLTFGSAVDNRGAGPLIVDGSRASRKEPEMRADQVIVRSDGSTRVIEGVGALRFVVSPDHRHWHVLGFDRFELRRAHNFKLLLRDRKTGFCLGDRYAVDPAAHLTPAFARTRCGPEGTGLLRVREGISPGFGDDYKPELEGQYLDITGLPAGRYDLTHRANSDETVLESDYSNNASSVLFRLDWDGDQPRIEVLNVCPGAERCQAPPG